MRRISWWVLSGLVVIAHGGCGGAPVPQRPHRPPELAPVPVAQGGRPQVESSADIAVSLAGYPVDGPKLAVYRSASPYPVAWEVIDDNGRSRLAGRSAVVGEDAASGTAVHWIDFSALNTPLAAARVVVAGRASPPFAITDHWPGTWWRDAFRFLYHQRANTPIRMPFAEQEAWQRDAGTPGDTQAQCLSADDPAFAATGLSKRVLCRGARDVRGGWYDAGDHGKYVVSGALAVWLVQHTAELMPHLDPDHPVLADGALHIPESGNGVPDLLDEARWELEFFLRMQETSGRFAGMVHHKVHDDAWTGIPLDPARDPRRRILYPVSTTATLDAAAVFAQGARLWRRWDAAFSDRLLEAARRAWRAARRVPVLPASSDGGHGGGPYDDPRAEDETYWAAVELWLTTGDKEYAEAVRRSPFFAQIPAFLQYDEVDGVYTWKDVAPLGSLSLLAADAKVPADWRDAARQSLQEAADRLVQVAASTGYAVPLRPSVQGAYPWGSNYNVVNGASVCALAYHLLGDPVYRDTAVLALTYLLGRNPAHVSYVTQVGTPAVTQPHHRFFARAKDARFPPPPPGVLVGGPNSGIQDPVARQRLEGCAPATCWVDDIDSWSTNEVAIYWNAALAHLVVLLDTPAGRADATKGGRDD